MRSATPRRPTPPPWRVCAALALCTLAWLGGCSSGPLARRTDSGSERDGPEANPPPDLARVPDAEPRLEPIRSGGPNKPYDVLGRSYVPITQDPPYTERGLASWYGRKFNGKRTSSGELYNMYGMTAAHPTLPIPSYARIRNPANGREVVVRINDRGPFHASRIVDLSYTAALKLDLLRGVAPVELQRITFDEIRTGSWRRGGGDTLLAVGAPPARAVAVPWAGVANVVATPLDDRSVSALETTPASARPAASPVSVEGEPPLVGPAAPVSEAAEPQKPDTPAAPAAASPDHTPVLDAPPARAYTGPSRGYWVQLGAFRAREGAEGFQHRVAVDMEWLSPLLAIFSDASIFRLQAGPYPSRDEARRAAERVRDGLKLVPVIVERR